MTQLEKLRKIQGYLKNPSKESLQLSLADTHHPDIFSLVIQGTEFGKLTRVFIAKKKLKPFEVQLHSHRYPIHLTSLSGNIKHFMASEVELSDLVMSKFEYKSPLNGGSGLKYLEDVRIIINEYPLPIGSSIDMSEEQIHTMSCSEGAMWVVEEQGFKKDSSVVLGVPFITDGLYNKPKMFEINDNFQLVLKTVNRLINEYNSVL